MNITDLLSCDDHTFSCYQKIADVDRKPRDYFTSSAFVEDLVVPVIGDTIKIYDINAAAEISIILTEDNYSVSIIKWMRDVQYKCGVSVTNSVGNEVIQHGKITFFPYNEIKGTRPKSAKKQGNAMYDGSVPPPVGITAKTNYSLADLWANQCFVNDMLYNRKKLSIINFSDTVFEVLREEDDYTIVPIDGGLDWKGDNKNLEGALEIDHEGKRDACLHIVPKSSLKEYQAELKLATKYHFATGTINIIDGDLTAENCARFSECIPVTVTNATAFSFKNLPIENLTYSSCVGWKLFYNCNEPIPATLPILIDSNTGIVTCTGLPTIGKTYKFTVTLENQCCVYGSYCIEITTI